jgi:P27 family predicted phage terminase small subunit
MESKPPAGLNAAGKAAWVDAWAVLEASGDDPELSRATLFRYCDAVETWMQLRRSWRKLGSPAVTAGGATGSASVAHPLLSELGRARDKVNVLSEALGLDPAARRKLGRRVSGGQPGAHSAPDRTAPRRTLKRVS